MAGRTNSRAAGARPRAKVDPAKERVVGAGGKPQPRDKDGHFVKGTSPGRKKVARESLSAQFYETLDKFMQQPTTRREVNDYLRENLKHALDLIAKVVDKPTESHVISEQRNVLVVPKNAESVEEWIEANGMTRTTGDLGTDQSVH